MKSNKSECNPNLTIESGSWIDIWILLNLLVCKPVLYLGLLMYFSRTPLGCLYHSWDPQELLLSENKFHLEKNYIPQTSHSEPCCFQFFGGPLKGVGVKLLLDSAPTP